MADEHGVMAKARDYTAAVQELMKTGYWLGMKDKLEAGGYQCGDLIEPPESASITVETDAPEAVRMEISNAVLLELADKFEHDKSLPKTWRMVMSHTLRSSVKSDKEIQAAKVRDCSDTTDSG